MKKLESLKDFKKFEINEIEKKSLTGGIINGGYTVTTEGGSYTSAFCGRGGMAYTSDIGTYDEWNCLTSTSYSGLSDANPR